MLKSKVLLFGLAILNTQTQLHAAEHDAQPNFLDHLSSDQPVSLFVPHASNAIDLSNPENQKPGLLCAFEPLLLEQHKPKLAKIDRQKLDQFVITLDGVLTDPRLSNCQKQQLRYKRDQFFVFSEIVREMRWILKPSWTWSRESLPPDPESAPWQPKKEDMTPLEDMIAIPELPDNTYCPEPKQLLKNPNFKCNRDISACYIADIKCAFGNALGDINERIYRRSDKILDQPFFVDLCDPTNQRPEILLALKARLLRDHQQRFKAMDGAVIIRYISMLNLCLKHLHMPCDDKWAKYTQKILYKKQQMLALVHIIQEAQTLKRKTR